jgi:hypothetical protein
VPQKCRVTLIGPGATAVHEDKAVESLAKLPVRPSAEVPRHIRFRVRGA